MSWGTNDKGTNAEMGDQWKGGPVSGSRWEVALFLIKEVFFEILSSCSMYLAGCPGTAHHTGVQQRGFILKYSMLSMGASQIPQPLCPLQVHVMFLVSGGFVVNIDGLVQNCSNSSALVMKLLQSCTKPSICASSEAKEHDTQRVTSSLPSISMA